MDNCCFQVVIRQRACQNGVPIITERAYNNIPENEVISLNYGYSLTLSTLGSNNILVNFTNVSFEINLTFSMTNPGIGVFDLPIEGGTFRISITSIQVPCNNDICCPNNRRNF